MRLNTILLALLALVISCGKPATAVEDGVSLELARYRSEMVSDVRYDIAFRIPEMRSERVEGRETITFSLRSRTSLQLDFREGRDAVLSLKVNGRDCPIHYQNEHVVLIREALKKGENTVEVAFISGDRSLNRNEDYLYTLFVPDRARTVFPCFDQPDIKGRFSLTLDVPAEWEAVANGSVQNTEVAGGRKLLSRTTLPPSFGRQPSHILRSLLCSDMPITHVPSL